MLFGKKTAVALSSMILLSVIGACSSNITPMAVSANGNANFSDSNLVTRISADVTQSKQDPNHFYIDAGKGQKTGASLTVTLNLGAGGFKTKATSSGAPGSIASDIASLDVALIEAPTATAPVDFSGTTGVLVKQGTLLRSTGGIPTITGYTAGVAGVPGTAGSASATTITFTNVPANTAGTNSYYVAAAAFDVATPALANNITNVAGTVTGTLGSYYLSSTKNGVDAGIDANLRPAYLVRSTIDLALTLKLKDATQGAQIGTAVTINDGVPNYNALPGVGVN